jgi:hypothetical protein
LSGHWREDHVFSLQQGPQDVRRGAGADRSV